MTEPEKSNALVALGLVQLIQVQFSSKELQIQNEEEISVIILRSEVMVLLHHHFKKNPQPNHLSAALCN